MATPAYRPRLVDGLIDELLAELPAVMVTGPRAAGKTTTAARHAASLVHLDRPAEAAVFHADPDVALSGSTRSRSRSMNGRRSPPFSARSRGRSTTIRAPAASCSRALFVPISTR